MCAAKLSPSQLADLWDLKVRARNGVIGFEHAAGRDDVKSFRGEWLPGGQLLRGDRAVRKWLQEHSTEPDAGDGRPWVVVSMDQGKAWQKLCPGPVLRELSAIADELNHAYGWIHEDAARWIIAEGVLPASQGGTFLEPDIMTSMEGPEPGKHWSVLVEIKIPIDTPIERVAAIWRDVQREHGSLSAFRPTHRPPDARSMERMLFAIERNDGRSWGDVMLEWEAKQKAVEYKDDPRAVTRFTADVRRTYRQIMGGRLVWKKRPGKPSKTDDN